MLTFDDALDAIRHGGPDVTEVTDNHRHHALSRSEQWRSGGRPHV
jgi:hypothetical protein